MLNKNKYALYFFVVFFALFSLPKMAHATCSYVVGGSQMNANWFLGDIVVPKNASVGSTVFTRDVLMDSVGNHTALWCTRTGLSFTFNFAVMMSGNNQGGNVFASGISGIGLKLSTWSIVPYYQMPTTPILAPFTQPITVTGSDANSYWGSGNQMLRIEIVRTEGALGADTLNYSVPNFMTATDSDNSLIFANLNITGKIVTTCSVTTPNILVELDDINGSELTEVDITRKPKNFNVDMSCDRGANIDVQLVGTQDTDTVTPGVLKLSNAGAEDVAKGVGIQILYNNAQIALNSKIRLKTTSAVGDETFPFTARYYQTLAPDFVKAGKANATATLNVTYQ